jgi:hypothetical protein
VAFRRLRSIARGGYVRSQDPHAIQRELDRWLKRRMSTSGDPVQFVGEVHTAATYAAWRAEQLARMPNATVPTLPAERWPMVLWAMKPAAVPAFISKGLARDLYAAPQVGMFTAEVDREVALAGMIAAYLGDLSDAVQIAPPILGAIGRGRRKQARLAPLDRAWTLPATEAVGVRS